MAHINKGTQQYIQASNQLHLKHSLLSPSLVKIYSDKKSHLFFQSSPPLNNATSIRLSADKHHTNLLLYRAKLPVPQQQKISTFIDAKQFYSKHNPIVIKPTNSQNGSQVFANISNLTLLKSVVKKFPKPFLIEKYHQGDDYRFLILNQKLIGLVRRKPPSIVGDGIHTIKQLVKQKSLNLDDQITSCLTLQKLTPQTIPQSNQTIILRHNANISTGGTSTTINPKLLHPELIKLATQAAQQLNLDFSGVDIIIKNPHNPIKNNAIVIEVNSNPCLWLHTHPHHGTPQLVAHTILKHIFNL